MNHLETHQTSPDGTVRSEYADKVAEKRFVDRGKVHWVNLQPNGGQRSGVFRGVRLLQLFRAVTTSNGR